MTENSHFKKESIFCPFCKEPRQPLNEKTGVGVDIQLEGSGGHSVEYPNAQTKYSLCGGCADADFEIKKYFQFHRCPRCMSVFIELDPTDDV